MRLFRRLIPFSAAVLGTLTLLLAGTGLRPAQAQIVNGGFEDPVLASGGTLRFTGGQTIGTSGWTVVGTAVTLLQTNYAEPGNGVNPFNAQEGLNSLDLTGNGNEGTTSGVTQSIVTTPGQTYEISFFVGRANSSTGSGFYIGPAIADLSINGGPRVSFANSNATPVGSLNWQQFFASFTATGATSTVTFFNGTASANQNEVGLDNVTISVVGSAAAPEASTAALTAVGLLPLLGALAARRKRRK